MRLQVKKWGNSASVRIPAAVMAAARLEIDQTVEVREDNGRIVIEPVRAPVYTLEELLADMDYSEPLSAEDREWLDAPAVGKEVW
jgi:antitoxin MazE